MSTNLPLAATAIAIFFATAVNAQPTPAPVPAVTELVDLEGDQSRADLFKLVVAASEAEGGDVDPSTGIPFALLGPFAFPNDAINDIIGKKPRENSIFGVDISHYTASDIPLENFSLMRIRYVYCKASQGTTFRDRKFNSFWTRLGSLPSGRQVHRGAYHFLTAAGSGKDQARTFLRVLNSAGGLQRTDMPPVLDLEWDVAGSGAPDRWAGTDPDNIIQKVIDWMEIVERETGRTPVLYTARAWWRERIGSESKISRLSNYKIWIADYSRSSRAVEVPKTPNSVQWGLWQFTDSAKLARGWPGSMDANIYKGTEDQFYADFALAKFQ